MNKTWSIILIVVASLVVLGGTYWYFGLQKPKTQESTAVVASADPVQGIPTGGKKRAAASSDTQAAPPLTQPVDSPKQKPAEPEDQKAESKPAVDPKQKPEVQKTESEPAVDPKQSTPDPEENALPAQDEKKKPRPAQTVPSIADLTPASFGLKGEKAGLATDKPTSVLLIETLPAQAATAGQEMEIDTEEPVAAEAGLTPDSAAIDESTIPEEEQIASVEKETPSVEEPTAPVEKKTSPTPPQAGAILTSTTAAVEKKEGEEEKKATFDANLSVSILDYNFPIEFNALEKSFTVSLDLMSQKEVFGWGGTLEAGKNKDTDVVQISLLAKTEWKLGKDDVTFPLSISLGPTLFINTAAGTTGFGMKARLGAGVSYAIAESFRIFYAVGIGATYDFVSPSFRFVLEPIRIGVGFSF